MSTRTLKPLSCAGCAAPLTVAPDQQIVTCSYCKQSHTFMPPPPPEPADSSYDEGDEVAVLWGGCWWPARIVRVVSERSWHIHYEGWGSLYDETVGSDRIRHCTGSVRTPAGSVRASAGSSGSGLRLGVLALGAVMALGVGMYFASTSPGRAGTGSTTDSAREARGSGDPNASYVEGEKVDIHWGDKWWPGQIKKVQSENRYLISYDGWAANWNEVVTPKRLRRRGH